jgi:hypothetical protein
MTTKKAAKSLADYRNLYDANVIVPAKIRKALDSMLAAGKESWEYEGDFIQLAGISTTQLGQFRDAFSAHVVETPAQSKRASRRVWFADPKVAKVARGED